MEAAIKRTRFISFSLALDIDDADVKAFQKFLLAHKRGVMLSSDPYMHAIYLGHHLKNVQQLTGYIKCMTGYFEYEGNMLPAKIAADQEEFLKALQRVADWFIHEQNKNA